VRIGYAVDRGVHFGDQAVRSAVRPAAVRPDIGGVEATAGPGAVRGEVRRGLRHDQLLAGLKHLIVLPHVERAGAHLHDYRVHGHRERRVVDNAHRPGVEGVVRRAAVEDDRRRTTRRAARRVVTYSMPESHDTPCSAAYTAAPTRFRTLTQGSGPELTIRKSGRHNQAETGARETHAMARDVRLSALETVIREKLGFVEV